VTEPDRKHQGTAASRFDADALWEQRLGLARTVVREELVARQLRRHLPAVESRPTIVDVGCGQGTQILRLARDGYDVVGIDPSEHLLNRARRDLASEPMEVQDRVTLKRGTVERLADVIQDEVDVLLCHGVVMYLTDLEMPLRHLADRLRRGGTLSLLTRNQAAIAMRAGMTARWDEFPAAFDASTYRNNLGIDGVRADRLHDLIEACERLGMFVDAWYGVRLFTDHWETEQSTTPIDMAQILDAEEAAGERDPYRMLAALTHVIATRA